MMVDFTPLDLVICLAVLAANLYLLWRQGRGWPYLVCFAVFGVYLIALLSVVIFPFTIPDTSHGVFPNMLMPSFNLIPFYFGPCYSAGMCVRGILQNVVLTFPFGFGLSFLMRVRPKQIWGWALAVGVGLELAQLLVSIIFKSPFRIVDINDLILNAAGVLFGYGIFWLFARGFLRWTRKRPLRPTDLITFLQRVTLQTETP